MAIQTTHTIYADLVDQARSAPPRDPELLEKLLDCPTAADQELLFAAARRARQRHFGDQVFLYGFLYFSTYCRNDCHFCHYRRSHTALPRYRKDPDEILITAQEMARTGVHLVDLTMGEDPYYVNEGAEGIQALADLVRRIKTVTGLPLMISPGLITPKGLALLHRAGADWYACYQETHTPALFARLRPGQSYDDRMAAKRKARQIGMLVEEGLLLGVGETTRDVAASITAMATLDAHQVRAMTFVPQDGTPMNRHAAPDVTRELITIAVMRLAFPDRLIPASLDVEGQKGLAARLMAGANVVTSLVPPNTGLAGVANEVLDIDAARRTPAGIGPILAQCGLKPASVADYTKWVAQHQRMQMVS